IIGGGEERAACLLRLPKFLRELNVSPSYFAGGFSIVGKGFRDSIDFITDSVLLHTGSLSESNHAVRWNIVEYKKYQFLNIQDEINETLLIPIDIRENEVEFWKHPWLKFERSKLFNDSSLSGNWIVFRTDYENPAIPIDLLPPFLKKQRHVRFFGDSLENDLSGRAQTSKWKITSDGGRIYFDNVLSEDVSWRVLRHKNDTLVLKLNGHSGVWQRIEYLRKQ
ncbi:MAG: hypothetical protein ACKOE6_10825, partial [Flammeovirgaceae bacterium]